MRCREFESSSRKFKGEHRKRGCPGRSTRARRRCSASRSTFVTRVAPGPGACRVSFIVRNLDRAAADEFAHDRVAGNDVVTRGLGSAQAFDAFEQGLHALVADARVQKTGVRSEILRSRQQPALAEKKGFQRGQIQWKNA